MTILEAVNREINIDNEVRELLCKMPNYTDMGFTEEDRKNLITLTVEFRHFVERFEANDKRFEKIEGRLDRLEPLVWKSIAYASGACAVVFTLLKLIWK